MNEFKSQFGKWTSNNEVLDNFIRESQLNVHTPYDYIQWIPFEKFTNIECIVKGGFVDLRIHYCCSLNTEIIDCYGVSRDPKTGNYGMVMQYAGQGNLRHYLSNNFINLMWNEKIELFGNIVKELKEIHDARLDLVYITDFGMYHSVNKPKDSRYYVISPYMVPESHDYNLACEICLGLRPSIISGTPEAYMDAILHCWDRDPSKHPTIDELLNVLYKFSRLLDFSEPQNSDNDYVLSYPMSEDEIEEINMLD
ncbi:3586_t:CDS:2 [Gigaspora margarita]|uniref:3586_t:CDS:1 n=1 Tax=Gigaspora margarita TaxID=4874 RepID=A0ABN7UKH6_GIGMA|nr:3586_t:CDS:2 [Gigaspora margarita]